MGLIGAMSYQMSQCPFEIEIGKVIMGQFQKAIESCDHFKKAETILTYNLWNRELQFSILIQSIDQDIHDPAHNHVPVAVLLVDLALFIVFVVVSIGSVAAAVAVVVAESHDR